MVHGLLSSQTRALPPAQLPVAQVSPLVQALPSSHGAVDAVPIQPEPGSQLSRVQGLPSLQTFSDPALQTPPAQTSCSVHGLPSSHGAVLATDLQPSTGSQLSVVQSLPSLQSVALPPAQLPPAHASSLVQGLPSLQGALFGV